MPSTSKILIAVAVALAVIAGGYWLMKSNGGLKMPGTSSIGVTPAAPTDISDTALEQDIAAVAAQLDALDQDATAIDKELSDKPIQQTE